MEESYELTFEGAFTCTPALTNDQYKYLVAFSRTKHVSHPPQRLAEWTIEPLRDDVGLPLGDEGEFHVDKPFTKWTSAEKWKYETDHPRTMPNQWCHWRPSSDRSHIEWNGAPQFYGYFAWLEFMLEHFFRPWGITLSGKVDWIGSDPDADPFSRKRTSYDEDILMSDDGDYSDDSDDGGYNEEEESEDQGYVRVINNKAHMYVEMYGGEELRSKDFPRRAHY